MFEFCRLLMQTRRILTMSQDLDQVIAMSITESTDTEEGSKLYDVFRKKFHVPQAWASDPRFEVLLTHRYTMHNVGESFRLISNTLKSLGYVHANNDAMIHDYMHFMLMDLFRKNGEVFVTKNDIKGLEAVSKLLNNTTPDFVIKRNGERKTTIVKVYVGSKDLNEIKSKYKKLAFFADFKIVTKDNFAEQLQHILPKQDLAYLQKHLEIFLVEHQYWSSCTRMQKILFNDIENTKIVEFDFPPTEGFEQYKDNLTTYAQKVLQQDDI